ncbi:hypothetical protein P171DRAFT_88955 [Karstenula rhodostoma CBS 690.94]|uniref:Uncharacterized protein n=1 Tax=Karstenula rhodostoma CBS 690.94 TaxID=1392251 RepID=A0A9P4PDC0_9PLEO|nr:hypothetical protein P171DRAFT_88955 [Karstenula rhodostoma CBS 690.94]
MKPISYLNNGDILTLHMHRISDVNDSPCTHQDGLSRSIPHPRCIKPGDLTHPSCIASHRIASPRTHRALIRSPSSHHTASLPCTTTTTTTAIDKPSHTQSNPRPHTRADGSAVLTHSTHHVPGRTPWPAFPFPPSLPPSPPTTPTYALSSRTPPSPCWPNSTRNRGAHARARGQGCQGELASASFTGEGWPIPTVRNLPALGLANQRARRPWGRGVAR